MTCEENCGWYEHTTVRCRRCNIIIVTERQPGKSRNDGKPGAGYLCRRCQEIALLEILAHGDEFFEVP